MAPPDTGRHGAFTSSEQMLTTIQAVSTTVAVIDQKLDEFAKNTAKVEKDVGELRKEVDNVKAKLYTMSGVIGVAVSVATNWVTSQIS